MSSTVDPEVLEDVLRTSETIIRGVQPGQHALPTPCPDYDAGTMVNHMVGWLQVFADGASQRPPEANPASYEAGDRAGDDFHEAAERAVDAFRAGAADRPIDLGNGPSPGAMIFGMMLMEYIGHGWDLAVATDQPTPYSERSIAAAQEAARATLKPEYRGHDKSFGDIVPVAADATSLDQLVGFLGRNPSG